MYQTDVLKLNVDDDDDDYDRYMSDYTWGIEPMTSGLQFRTLSLDHIPSTSCGQQCNSSCNIGVVNQLASNARF